MLSLQPAPSLAPSLPPSLPHMQCSKERANVNLPRLLAYLLKLTKCPPMVHSLYLLYENSFLTLSGWVSACPACPAG